MSEKLLGLLAPLIQSVPTPTAVLFVIAAVIGGTGVVFARDAKAANAETQTQVEKNTAALADQNEMLRYMVCREVASADGSSAAPCEVILPNDLRSAIGDLLR